MPYIQRIFEKAVFVKRLTIIMPTVQCSLKAVPKFSMFKHLRFTSFFGTHLKAARTVVSFTARGRSVPLSAVTGTDEYVSKLTVSKIVLMIIHEIVSSIKSKRSLDFNLGSETAKV